MDRVRASSLESNKTVPERYDTYPSTINQSNLGRNRLSSLMSNQRELSEESASLDYYFNRDCQRPTLSNSELKSQLDLLQCTVNKMLNIGAFDEHGSSCHSVNISDALKHEYHQMMSALKDLENILSLKRNTCENVNFSNTSSINDSQVHQLQREIYYRDSLIKCLSDRLKVLCKANDKLIIDYENQENMLSEELLSLKHQLEKAKDAIRTLSHINKRSAVSSNQDLEKELYYLRESLCTKDMIISDLKHRADRLSRENMDLKCELDNKEDGVSRGLSSQFERELCYMKHTNEQMKNQIDNLNHNLDMKTLLISDLQNRLECNDDGELIRDLREQCLMMNDENELHKEEILEQMEMLEDLRNQLDILSENTQFKDDTISDLKSCLRKLTNSISATSVRDERGSQSVPVNEPKLSSEMKTNTVEMLLSVIKRDLNENHPDLLRLLGPETNAYTALHNFVTELTNLVHQQSGAINVVELFKEFLTNEINLKNKIGHFITDHVTEKVDAIQKLQSHLNHLLSIDMDGSFNDDLRNYLHQCYLLDDHLRLVIEYFVKYFSNIPKKSIQESQQLYQEPTYNSDLQLKMVEDELRMISTSYRSDKSRFVKELVDKENELSDCKRLLKESEIKVKDKTETESSYKMLLEEKSRLLSDSMGSRNKIKDLSMDNERLQTDNERMASKIKQMERNLNLQTSELDNLENSMRKLSTKFVNLSSTNESVKSSIDSCKDTQIDKLSRELECLKSQNSDLQQTISDLKSKIDDQNTEKNELLESLSQIKQEKEYEIKKLQSKLTDERRNSVDLKALHVDNNHSLELCNKQLKDDNARLTESLSNCVKDKDKLELKINDIKTQMLDQENAKATRLQSDNCSLKLENSSLEMRSNSLESEKTLLSTQLKQVKFQLDELNKKCVDHHVDKTIWQRDSEDATFCKQKLFDLEGILASMTEELNDKAKSLEDIRKMIKSQPLIDLNLDSKCEKVDKSEIQQLLLSHKDSEIAYLKSKLESNQLRKSIPISNSKTRSLENSDVSRLTQTINELEYKVDQLNKQLSERSNTISTLQSLVREKDGLIENASKVIKTKNESLMESEKLVQLMSLQNTNLKDESQNGSFELKMLKSSDNNLKDEIQRLKEENEHIKDSYRNSLKVEQSKNYKSQSFDLLPQKSSHVVIKDNSVAQINQEIKKLYGNFEDKNKELKEHSLKEIKCREIKLDNVNLELKLKTDQIQKILIENKRLSDLMEDESQRSSKVEQNLLLKEQLLQKLLREKEKIRATFITELSDKNNEIKEKSKTVYFLNAELHRLSSDLEILNAELHTVKTNEQFSVTQSRTLEIIEAELNQIKEENTSLKFCVNLKMVESEAIRNELTITQAGKDKLSNDLNCLKNEITEKESRLSQTFEEQRSTKQMLSSMETDTQFIISKLQTQLNQIRDEYRDMEELKRNLERAVNDLSNENVTLKNVRERLENEKSSYIGEINDLNKKIEMLSGDLSQSRELLCRTSGKLEREKESSRRLSDVMDISEQCKMIKSNELEEALRQLDQLSCENVEYKNEIDRLMDIVVKLQDEDKMIRDGDRKVRFLEVENEGIIKELDKHQYLEMQLDEHIKRKSMECEDLRKEHDDMLKIIEKYQQQVDNCDHLTQQLLNESTLKCDDLQVNLDDANNQLFIMEEKWTNCNNQWFEKYELLRNNYEKLEYDFMQQQHQLDVMKQSNATRYQDFVALNKKNQEYSRSNFNNSELDRLQCENENLQKYNFDMSLQIETLTTELVAAHTEIWNATTKINENQSVIGKLCSRLNNRLSTDRRYASQPLLSSDDLCSSDYGDLQQRDYNDLKNRYNALCSQVDNMICQLKKKDKRISELENENEIHTFNSLNYEQMKCDYSALEVKYQRLKAEHCTITQQFHIQNQDHLLIQDHEVQAIQSCTDELQETIQTQNQELDQLKSSHEMLANDYEGCCQRLKLLENQVELAHLELGNWQNTYQNKAENVDYLKSEMNNLRKQNDIIQSKNEEMNNLKQEMIDISGRMVEVMNCNMNLEQQSTNYRQKILNQKQTIEDLQRQLNNLESYYECEVDQCRRDLMVLKGNDVTYSTEVTEQFNEKNNTINCLNEEIQSAQREIHTFNEQLSEQCERNEQMKQDLNNEVLMKNELQQECREHCCNIEQLSAQLFDQRDLTERLSIENHRMLAEVEEKQCIINMLSEKIREKDNEIKECLTNIGCLENKLTATEEERRNLLNQVEDFADELDRKSPDHLMDMNRLKNELTKSYDIIDRLKHDLTKISVGNERINNDLRQKEKLLKEKEQQLRYFNDDLEMSNNEIERLKCELSHRANVSTQELNQLKDTSHKLSGELNYLQQKMYAPSKSTECQTLLGKEKSSSLSHSRSSEFIFEENVHIESKKDKNDLSEVSETTYSSSKSVTWKTTHTDKREGTENEVMALQQAIDDYNTLITDLTVPDNVEATSFETHSSERGRKTPSTKHTSPHFTAYTENRRLTKTDVAEVIFVEVDEPCLQNISIPSNVEITSVCNADIPKFVDIMELLRHCNIDVDYDENKESPDMYFGRVMNRYKELEQYFVASMRIQLKHKLDEETVDMFENFSENMVNNREMLNEQCRHLNDMLRFNTVDLQNDMDVANAKVITEEDIDCLKKIVGTQQMQSAAFNVAFDNLQEISPLSDIKRGKCSQSNLSLPYKKILDMQDDCTPNIESATTAVSQLPFKKVRSRSSSVELHSTEIMVTNVQNDSRISTMQSIAVKHTISLENIEMPNENYAAESETTDVLEVSMQQRMSKDRYSGSIRIVSKSESHDNEDEFEFHALIIMENNFTNDSYSEDISNKDVLETSLKLTNTEQKSNSRKYSKSKSLELQSTESKVINRRKESLGKLPKKKSTDSSNKFTIHGQEYHDAVVPVDNTHYSEASYGVEASIKSMNVRKKSNQLNSLTDIKDKENSSESFQIKVAIELEMGEMSDIVEMDSVMSSEHQTMSIVVKSNIKTDSVCLQNVSEGLSIREGQAKVMDQLEDNLSYASMGHFEKAMHQLNEIDFDNLDSSISNKDRVRIYAAEIDYLNEKNLFHTYTINVLTDPIRFPYNSNFLDDVNESLFMKAKHLNNLQTEFNFDPHISTKEKALISKVLDSDYTYKQQFTDWIELEKDLRERLQNCLSKEKELKDLQHKLFKVIEENRNLKENIKYSEDQINKSDNLESNLTSGRVSKIPLLKGSSIEGPPTNQMKASASLSLSSYDQKPKTRSDNIGMTLNKSDKLVTPAEVRLAIAGETSIDNLRRFSNLLAEDNFDLASEIEKLLSTIEELRRQLKENCEILSETVEMLQNSEVFVNDLEKKLSAETKKTQIISNRVDKLNEVNKQIVVELQRILKENAPPANPDMDVQERCNYLLLCLNKLESANKGLEDVNKKLLKQLETTKSGSAFDFLSSDQTDSIDFEFETTLLPNGTIVGDLSLVQSNDITKKVSLSFEVHSSKEERNQSVSNEGSKVSRFLIEQEVASSPVNRASMNKSENDIVSRYKSSTNKNNFNNNCSSKNYPISSSFSNLSFPTDDTGLLNINKYSFINKLGHLLTMKDIKGHLHSKKDIKGHLHSKKDVKGYYYSVKDVKVHYHSMPSITSIDHLRNMNETLWGTNDSRVDHEHTNFYKHKWNSLSSLT